MADRLTFRENRLEQVIHIDATVAGRADFLATHTPFRNLKYQDRGGSSGKEQVMDEEEMFRRAIVERQDRHGFLVVQGDNGTGKSHLIRWMKERYEGETDPAQEAVLLITRSQNTLRGALEQLRKAEIFPDVPELNKLDEANRHLSDDALRNHILLNFALIAREAYDEGKETPLEPRHLRNVYDLLVDRTVQEVLVQPEGPIERIRKRLVSDEARVLQEEEPRFQAADFSGFTSELSMRMVNAGASNAARRMVDRLALSDEGPELRERLALFLNQNLEEVVQNCTNLRASDLKDIFERLRRYLKAQSKRLTLFIEDITSFTGIDNALVEVLVTEHTGTSVNEEFCRLTSVVGVTNSYYLTAFPDNLKDRVTGRVILDQQALSSDGDGLLEMAARYLNAITLPEQELDRWLNRGGIDSDLPIAPMVEAHRWAILRLPDGREMSLFPFNQAALRSLYRNLPTQTPRAFVRDVILYGLTTFNRCAIGTFPPSVERFELQVPPWDNPLSEMKVREQAGHQAGSVATLLRCWGDATIFAREDQTVGGLPTEAFQAFALPMISGVREAGTPITPPIIDPVARIPDQPKPKPGPPMSPPRPQVNPRETAFKAAQKELEQWQRGGKLTSHDVLRDDLIELLLDFVDWQAEGVAQDLVTSYVKKPRICIEGQTGETRFAIFTVGREMADYYALLALAAWRHLGNMSWDFPESALYLANLYSWLLKVRDRLVKAVSVPPGVDDPDTWRIGEWSLAADYFAQVMSGNLEPHAGGAEALYQVLVTRLPEPVPQDSRAPEWRDLQVRLGNNTARVQSNHDFSVRYLNRWQGAVEDRSDRLFLDARQALEWLEKAIACDWDFEELSIPDAPPEWDMWHQAISLLQVFRGQYLKALVGEQAAAKTTSAELQAFLGVAPSEAEVEQLLAEARTFLQKTLQDAQEHYREDEFRALFDGSLTGKDLCRSNKCLVLALSQARLHDAAVHLSGPHPVAGVRRPLALLRNLSSLASQLEARYRMIPGGSGTVTGLVELSAEIKQYLEELYENLSSIGR